MNEEEEQEILDLVFAPKIKKNKFGELDETLFDANNNNNFNYSENIYDIEKEPDLFELSQTEDRLIDTTTIKRKIDELEEKDYVSEYKNNVRKTMEDELDKQRKGIETELSKPNYLETDIKKKDSDELLEEIEKSEEYDDENFVDENLEEKKNSDNDEKNADYGNDDSTKKAGKTTTTRRTPRRKKEKK